MENKPWGIQQFNGTSLIQMIGKFHGQKVVISLCYGSRKLCYIEGIKKKGWDHGETHSCRNPEAFPSTISKINEMPRLEALLTGLLFNL
jgi:hypothetical protein